MAANTKTLASFVAYCAAHPSERFWQALRNWSGQNFILASMETSSDLAGETAKDTFYWEGKDK